MRGLTKTAAGVAAVALAAGVIAGCGSSSDTASTAAAESVATDATATTAELTQAEYVAQANAICTKIDDVTSTLGSNADTETPEEAQAELDKAVTAASAGVAELKGLVPPAALAAAHATLVQTSGEAVDLASKLISAALAGNLDDPALVEDAKEAEALEAKQTAAAKELGLSDCFTGNATNGGDTTDGADDGAND